MARFAKDHHPKYRLYKRTGQAVVTIKGRHHYLGKYSDDKASPSRKKYAEIIHKWLAGAEVVPEQPRPQDTPAEPEAINIEQVIVAFWTHAKTYYRGDDGKPTGELENFKDALRTLRRLYGTHAAATFDAACLETCQKDMIRQGLARNTINRRIGRIRQVFKFAVRKKMVPAAVLTELQTVDGLKRNRSEAKETAKVRSVAESHARQAMNHASRHIAAMIELQWLTGMRSGEMVIMRTQDIDRSGPVWVYTPTKHKNQHHGHERIVPLGPKAQAIVTPFLKLDQAAYIFSPADATTERREAAAGRRTTPRSCGNVAGSNRKANPKRTPGERYTDVSYAQAVARACDKAFPPPEGLDAAAVAEWRQSHRFHPHQLRHSAATRFRRDYNLETARVLLGQKTLEAAEIYAEIDAGKARDVAAVSG